MRVIYDKRGREINEYDVIRVDHFTGARNKKYYMYKVVTVFKGELYAKHLRELTPGESRGYLLSYNADTEGRLPDTLIVEGVNF